MGFVHENEDWKLSAFHIEIQKTTVNDTASGFIQLGEFKEKFSPNLKTVGINWYRDQWHEALRTAVDDRSEAGVFSDVVIEDDKTGMLWVYSIIPSELVSGANENQNLDEQSLYFTQSFFFVTTDSGNFDKRYYETFDDGTKGNELSLYFLDLENPVRFFGYLSLCIAGVSSWKVNSADIKKFLKRH